MRHVSLLIKKGTIATYCNPHHDGIMGFTNNLLEVTGEKPHGQDVKKFCGKESPEIRAFFIGPLWNVCREEGADITGVRKGEGIIYSLRSQIRFTTSPPQPKQQPF